MKHKTGYFMEPQNFSVNDGNGIRTIIFFAGCPLSCQWCSNPEGCTGRYKVAYYVGPAYIAGAAQQFALRVLGSI
jgi:pyruvate formate lyase activating enzyme